MPEPAGARVKRTLQSTIGPMVQRMASSDWFAKVGPKVVPPLDRTLHRVTSGRVMMSQWMTPTLLLETTGHRSGEPRRAPLACVPEPDGGFIVVGSNFARTRHPAWSTNLIAHPSATVGYAGKEIQVTARLLEGEERATAWRRATAQWPAYDSYAAKVTRELRVFRLTPGSAEDTPDDTSGDSPNDTPTT